MTGHEGVIEGRPEIQVDWNAEYRKQRRSRLCDAIFDYLDDEKVDPRFVYEEILSVLEENLEYHKEQMDRVFSLKSLMLGHREVF